MCQILPGNPEIFTMGNLNDRLKFSSSSYEKTISTQKCKGIHVGKYLFWQMLQVCVCKSDGILSEEMTNPTKVHGPDSPQCITPIVHGCDSG